MNVRFADVARDLCESCKYAFKGGCPIWPPLNLVRNCIEYKKKK